jgi:hypothetical protein
MVKDFSSRVNTANAVVDPVTCQFSVSSERIDATAVVIAAFAGPALLIFLRAD